MRGKMTGKEMKPKNKGTGKELLPPGTTRQEKPSQEKKKTKKACEY
jgi:hypothetical protein